MGMLDEVTQGQPQQGQPQQGQPQRPMQKQPGQKDSRAVQEDPTQQARLQNAPPVGNEEANARQSPTNLDDDQELAPWEKAASEESQQEYENAVGKMATLIYDDDKIFDNLMNMVKNDDPVAGIIKAASTLVTEVDKKIDIPENVIPALPAQAFDMIHEMAVEAGVIEELHDEQVKTGTSAAQEMIMRAYGMDIEDFQSLTQGLTEKDVNELEGVYQEATQGHGIS